MTDERPTAAEWFARELEEFKGDPLFEAERILLEVEEPDYQWRNEYDGD